MGIEGLLQSKCHQGGPCVPDCMVMGSFLGEIMAELSLRGGVGDGGEGGGKVTWVEEGGMTKAMEDRIRKEEEGGCLTLLRLP